MSVDTVTLEYRCAGCGSVEWLESPMKPLRRFLSHFCGVLGANTVMTAIVPENLEMVCGGDGGA